MSSEKQRERGNKATVLRVQDRAKGTTRNVRGLRRESRNKERECETGRHDGQIARFVVKQEGVRAKARQTRGEMGTQRPSMMRSEHKDSSL